MNARMVVTSAGTATCTFPYDPRAVAAIKRYVPAHSRRYDPDDKAWIIAPAYRDDVREILEALFVTVEVVDAEHDTYTPPRNAGPHTSYTVLHLQPTAPPELVEAAYKTLSRLYHPDRGGDTVRMQELNTAISTIRRQVT